MAIVNFYDDVLNEKSATWFCDDGKEIKTVADDYIAQLGKSEAQEVYNTETGETYYKVIEPKEYKVAVIVNGIEKDLDYIIQKDDVITLVFIPLQYWSGSDTAATIFGAVSVGLGVVMSIAGPKSIGGLFIELGAAMIIGAISDSLTDDSSSSDEEKEAEDILKIDGGSNQNLVNQRFPMTLGTHLQNSFVAGSPYNKTITKDYDGTDGGQYIYKLFCMGYGPLKLTNFKIGDTYLAYNKSTDGTPRQTIMHGILSGVSGDSNDNGDILNKWKNNEVEIEILQAGSKAIEDESIFGSVYPQTVEQLSVKASLLNIQDGQIGDITLKKYGTKLLEIGFQTNTVRISRDCPKRLEVDIDFPSGLFATRTRTSGNNSIIKYYNLPVRLAVQWRYVKDGQASSNASSPDGWNNFDYIDIDGSSHTAALEKPVLCTLSEKLFEYNSALGKVDYLDKTNTAQRKNFAFNDEWITKSGKTFNFGANEEPRDDTYIPEPTEWSVSGTVSVVRNFGSTKVTYTSSNKATIKVSKETYESIKEYFDNQTSESKPYVLGKANHTLVESTPCFNTRGYLLNQKNAGKANGNGGIKWIDPDVYNGDLSDEYLAKCWSYITISVGDISSDFIEWPEDGDDIRDHEVSKDDINVSERRYTVVKEFTDEECRKIIDYNNTGDSTLDGVEVRVIRITPCYFQETEWEDTDIGKSHSIDSGYSAMTYSDVSQWTALRTISFDKDEYIAALDEVLESHDIDAELEEAKSGDNYIINGTTYTSKVLAKEALQEYYLSNSSVKVSDYPLRPMLKTDIEKFCYVAVKIKQDVSQTGGSSLNDFSCIASALVPKYNEDSNKWFPEELNDVYAYFHKIVTEGVLRTSTKIEEITEAEYLKHYLEDPEHYYKKRKGNDFVEQLKNEIFTFENLTEKTDSYINVNLNTRPEISGADLISAGYTTAESDKTYTVFSMIFNYTDEMIVLTPIVDSDTIITQTDLQTEANTIHNTGAYNQKCVLTRLKLSEYTGYLSIKEINQIAVIYKNLLKWVQTAYYKLGDGTDDEKELYYVAVTSLIDYSEEQITYQVLKDYFTSIGFQTEFSTYYNYIINSQVFGSQTITNVAKTQNAFRMMLCKILSTMDFMKTGLKKRYFLPETLEKKFITNNPASIALYSCIGPQVGEDAKLYDSFNLSSFAEFYKFCEGVDDGSYDDDGNKLLIPFSCNAVITSEIKLETLLQKIVVCGRSYIRRDDQNKYEILIGKPVDYPTCVINQQNTISKSNTRSFSDDISGYKISFVDETDNYTNNELMVLTEGEDPKNPSRTVESLELPYVTNRQQIYSLGMFNLASKLYQKEVYTRTVGKIGFTLQVGNVVLIQDDSLLVGKDNGARIRELIEDEDTIFGFIASDLFTWDGDENFGCTIVQPEKYEASRCVTMRFTDKPAIKGYDTVKKGLTNIFWFANPVNKNDESSSEFDSESEVYMVYPKVGNLVAFGDVTSNVLEAIIMSIKPQNNDKFELTLTPYSKELYTPAYKMPSFSNKMGRISREEMEFGFSNAIDDTDFKEQTTRITSNIAANLIDYTDTQIKDSKLNNAILTLYKRTSNEPDGPQGDATYNFAEEDATKKLVWEDEEASNNWTQNIPDGEEKLWAVVVSITSKEDVADIPSENWSEPKELSSAGGEGTSAGSAYLWIRSIDTPTKPTEDCTYDFSTGTITGDIGDWSQNMNNDTDETKSLWVISAAVIGQGTGTIKADDWNGPVLYTKGIAKSYEITSDVDTITRTIKSTNYASKLEEGGYSIYPCKETFDQSATTITFNAYELYGETREDVAGYWRIYICKNSNYILDKTFSNVNSIVYDLSDTVDAGDENVVTELQTTIYVEFSLDENFNTIIDSETIPIVYDDSTARPNLSNDNVSLISKNDGTIISLDPTATTLQMYLGSSLMNYTDSDITKLSDEESENKFNVSVVESGCSGTTFTVNEDGTIVNVSAISSFESESGYASRQFTITYPVFIRDKIIGYKEIKNVKIPIKTRTRYIKTTTIIQMITKVTNGKSQLFKYALGDFGLDTTSETVMEALTWLDVMPVRPDDKCIYMKTKSE